jgi:hypothetical protein
MKYLAVAMLMIVAACTPYKIIQRISSGEVSVGLAVPGDDEAEIKDKEMVIDSVAGALPDGPILMNAIRDTETGDMVATDIIRASKVTARFRNVPERGGYVTIGFDVTVPSALTRSAWKMELLPKLIVQEDTLDLESLYITGLSYREAQLRGYQRYNRFIASIITDSSEFVRIGQLEIFLQRHFPETYAMKTDSSYVSDPMAENLFGVTQREALLHYKKHWKESRNDWKKRNRSRMYARYVKDPIVSDGVRLDTVVADGSGFVYRYTHRFRSRPGLKKAVVYLDGNLYEKGEVIMPLPRSDDMTYYISSLSSLADGAVKYRMIVLERTVYDNTRALIDFAQGRSSVDTLLGDNASELRRVRKCIDDVFMLNELVLDSLVISASCSPEGSYRFNAKLAESRSRAVCDYISEYVPEEFKDSLRASSIPENWEQLRLLVSNDTVMGSIAVEKIMSVTQDLTKPDETERKLSLLPQYRYLREKVYPKLRSVKFEFYLHRAGMVKDTVHTTEVDTVYMAGIQALRDLDYKRAVSLLRPYGDYNSALAFMSAEYNHSALDVLQKLDDTDPKVCYLMAMVLSRLEQNEMAQMYFKRALAYDPYLRHRANLDPEMSKFVTDIEEEY